MADVMVIETIMDDGSLHWSLAFSGAALRGREARRRRATCHKRVHRAVIEGILPHISECLCKHCGDPASIYHHLSYDWGHELDVIPLCDKCHYKVHHSGGKLVRPTINR